MNKIHPSKHPPLNSHCPVACRYSPNSAGPSWLPGDTADIHKNRVKVGGWGCYGGEGGVRWKSAICRRRINNEIQKSHSIAAPRTNSSVTVPDITSAVRLCARIHCFCKAAGRAGAFLTEKWNTAVQTIPLSGDTKASFLPQQYDIHLCFLSLPLR